MLWMTFSLTYSMANRQCQLWAGIFVVNPALKLKTTHAHRRYLYARECCRRETSRQCCSNAGPPSSMMIYIGPALVWHLVVACANPVLHPDLTHSVLLCSYAAGCGDYSFTSYLSQFVQGRFFLDFNKTSFLLNEPDHNERTSMQNRPPFQQTKCLVDIKERRVNFLVFSSQFIG